MHSVTVSVDLLNILIQFAREKGMDRQKLLNGCGLDPSVYPGDAARISMPEFSRILSFVQRQSADPDFGLHFGEYCSRMLSRHLLFSMMMNCRNVAQAIEKNFQYHNLITDMISPRLITSGSDASLTWEGHHPAGQSGRHFSESIGAIQASTLYTLTGDAIKIKQVRFSHDRPGQTGEHCRIFRSQPRFGCPRNEICFPASCLDKPVIFNNSSVLAGLEQLVRDQLHAAYPAAAHTDKISRMLSENILSGRKTTIETLSRDLAMGTRTLQLKLKQEGTSFRKIFDGVRKSLAVKALKETDTTLCEVALMLNFSDQSGFHNAFKKWTGQTPGQFRKKKNKGDGTS